jgi:hypothetical protein
LTYSSVLLRKLLEVKENELVNPVWNSMDPGVRNAVRDCSLGALQKINDRSLKLKLSDLIATVCENTYEKEEEWKELLQFIFNGLNADLSAENIPSIECAVYILSKIFGFVYDELTKGIELYITAFTKYFTSDNLSLRTKTVQAITEILCVVRKKDSRKFKDLIFYVLETTLKTLEQGLNQENNLKICLTALADLSSAEPNILKKSFSDLFILMGKVIEKKDYADEAIRELAFEVILTMIEKNDTLISKDEQRLKLFIELIFKFALEMDSDITDEWKTPKTESYFDEEFIPEEKLGTALSLIERLTTAVGSKKILVYLSDIVMQLLSHGGSDWRYKYIGFMTISQMVEHVDDIVNIENILPLIFNESVNDNPKIRFGTLHCISQISDSLNPQFQNNYHEKVIPVCISRLTSDDTLRNRLQACDALQTYLEFASDQVATTYCQAVLDACFGEFLKSDDVVTISLRESILNVISELVSACENNFTPYAEKCLSFLLNYFSEVLKLTTHKCLFGILLDTITVIGPKCQETYEKYLPDLITAIVAIQDNIPNSKDPIISYLHNAWERIVPVVKERFSHLAPKIIESALKLVSNPPTMAVSSEPEKKYDVKELLSGLASETYSGDKPVSIEKQKISLTTSETEDFIGCLELLNVIIETFCDMYIPYLEHTQSKTLPLLKYEVNEEVRIEASNSLPELLKVVKTHSVNNVEILHKTAKLYISELVTALENETDNAVIATFLDNMGSIVQTTGMFLTTPEINVLFAKILQVFDKVESHRLALLVKKDKVEEELVNEKESGQDKINSDDEESEDDIVGEIEKDIEEIEEVLVSIADVMGTLFNTHKELSLEIVNRLLTELLPKYFLEKASNFEKKMGLFILDDMIEFLGQNLLQNIWTDIARIILSYADSKVTELRQASCYGIGEFCKHTVKDFNLYVNDCLNALSKSLDVNSDGEDDEEWGHARDNAVAALGKIIKHQNQNIDVTVWVPKWLNLLPLKYDVQESVTQHTLLVEILISNPTLLLNLDNSNLPKILRILAKIYDTKFSNTELDKSILAMFDNVKQNPNLYQFVRLAKENCDSKVLKKLNMHFE